jgi:hypothetical protein
MSNHAKISHIQLTTLLCELEDVLAQEHKDANSLLHLRELRLRMKMQIDAEDIAIALYRLLVRVEAHLYEGGDLEQVKSQVDYLTGRR